MQTSLINANRKTLNSHYGITLMAVIFIFLIMIDILLSFVNFVSEICPQKLMILI